MKEKRGTVGGKLSLGPEIVRRLSRTTSLSVFKGLRGEHYRDKGLSTVVMS